MRPSLRTLPTRMALATAVALTPVAPALAQLTVLPPHSIVEGEPLGDWTAYFWQWAYSFSMPNDPFSDPAGAVYASQVGNVCYLGKTVARAITLHEGCAILVPLVGVELSQAELGAGQTEADLRAAAAATADQIDGLQLLLDGAAVPNLFDHREVSPAFQFVGARDNYLTLFGGPVGASGLAVSDGYFVMLAPPPPGTYTITFGGSLSSLDYSASSTLRLTIAAIPEPGTLALTVGGLAGLLVTARARRRRPHAR